MTDDDALLTEEIIQVLNEVDPVDLIRSGFPPDEYSPEARALAADMHAGRRMTTEVVAEIWEKFFGRSISARNEEIAGRLAGIQNHRGHPH